MIPDHGIASAKEQDTTTRITLTGDYYIGPGFSRPSREVIRRFIDERGFVVVNYEGSLRDGVGRRKAATLAMAEESLDLPPGCVLSLANNHILDYGDDGLRRTLDAVTASGMTWFGLEHSRGAGDNYTIVDRNGCRICLAGFGWRNEECVQASRDRPGVVDFTKLNIDRLFARLADERYDHLLVYVHAGYEFEYYPLPLHVGLSRYLIDRGASLVYGSHSHCIQPYEVYADRYIFYGLGNLVFSPSADDYPPVSDRGLIVSLLASPGRLVVEGVQRVQYERTHSTLSVAPDHEFLEADRLSMRNLQTYGRSYAAVRRRKRNPRPIMQYDSPIANALKYQFWLGCARVTGYLGMRQVVKRMLGWSAQ